MKYLKEYENFLNEMRAPGRYHGSNASYENYLERIDFINKCYPFSINSSIKIDLDINFKVRKSKETDVIKFYNEYDFIDEIIYTGEPKKDKNENCPQLKMHKKKKFIKKLFKDEYDFIDIYNFTLWNSTVGEFSTLLRQVKNRLIELFFDYEYQKKYLTENPEKYKDLEFIGYADGIKEEFSFLFDAEDLGLL